MRFNQPTTKNVQKGVREEEEEEGEVRAKVRAKGRQQEYERRVPNIEWCAATLVRCFPGPRRENWCRPGPLPDRHEK
jgi:hypothetical protein